MTQTSNWCFAGISRSGSAIVLATALATLAACSAPNSKSPSAQPPSGQPPSAPTAQLPTLKVAIASITLADDCAATDQLDQAEAKTAAEGQAKTQPYRPPCEQTTLQLQLTSSNPKEASKVSLRSVELLDADGKLLGELTARAPTKWQDTGNYVAWDQTVAGNQTVKASWPLSEPAWEKYGLTKATAAGRTFQVRVTVTTDGNDQVVAGQATVTLPRAILDPMIET